MVVDYSKTSFYKNLLDSKSHGVTTKYKTRKVGVALATDGVVVYVIN